MWQYYDIIYAIFCKKYYQYKRVMRIDVDEDYKL